MKIEEIHSLFLTCNSVCTDTRKIKKDDIFFALKGDNFNGNTYAQKALELGAKYVVIDESEFKTSTKTILVNNTLETLQNLASYHRSFLNIPIIGLTGSNGKTTTKELINAVLSQEFNTTATLGNLNNHIGVPLTLLSMNSNTEIGIVEMGANHLKEIDFLCNIAQPDYGYITNFGKAHLEGFGSIDGVIQGKSEMYNYLISNKKCIFINTDDPIQISKTKQSDVVSFGKTKSNAHVKIDFIDAQPFVKCNYNKLEINSVLIGNYNFNNIAAAITVGNYFKINDANIKKAIETYTPTNNRSQILEKKSNKIILDAYNANPTSMKAALLNFEKQKGNKIAILGDMFELGKEAKKEHQLIANLANSLEIHKIILVGENFDLVDINPSKTVKYKSFIDLNSDIKISSLENSIILIKGSRGMALERLIKND